jgi:hypothetical protein
MRTSVCILRTSVCILRTSVCIVPGAPPDIAQDVERYKRFLDRHLHTGMSKLLPCADGHHAGVEARFLTAPLCSSA